MKQQMVRNPCFVEFYSNMSPNGAVIIGHNNHICTDEACIFLIDSYPYNHQARFTVSELPYPNLHNYAGGLPDE